MNSASTGSIGLSNHVAAQQQQQLLQQQQQQHQQLQLSHAQPTPQNFAAVAAAQQNGEPTLWFI